MHIKTGSWEATNTVCESDPLCDPAAVLVSSTNSQPQIRNRRLSPGSGNCGGGGGGCISENNPSPQQPPTPQRHPSPEIQASNIRREKEGRKSHKGRSARREKSKRERKTSQKDRWVEDSLSLLKPPPAFPVQDSPAKLQPAVSYASKVKSGAAIGGLEEDRPAIGVLLQNQWGLSFISVSESAEGSKIDHQGEAEGHADIGPIVVQGPEEEELQATPLAPLYIRPLQEEEENNSKLLLSCRHLVEALNYHSREWNAVCNKEKKDPKSVVWYNPTQDNPA